MDFADAELASTSISFPGIFDDLLSRRTLMLACDVDEEKVAELVAAMVELNKRDSKAPINLIVASWGGSLADSLFLYDVIKSLDCPVNTLAGGKACSGGALILAAGTGTRLAYPSTRVMIHQPAGMAVFGTVTDNRINAKNDEEWKQVWLEALAEATGQPIEKVLADCERDKWFSATEAVAYGLVDGLVELHRRKPLIQKGA